MSALITSREVKERVVWAAGELMLRAGLSVSEARDGDTITLTVVIPPDSQDVHGDRLLAALE